MREEYKIDEVFDKLKSIIIDELNKIENGGVKLSYEIEEETIAESYKYVDITFDKEGGGGNINIDVEDGRWVVTVSYSRITLAKYENELLVDLDDFEHFRNKLSIDNDYSKRRFIEKKLEEQDFNDFENVIVDAMDEYDNL